MEQRGIWTWLGKIGMGAAGFVSAVIAYRIARGFVAGWSAATPVYDPMPDRADLGFEVR